MKTYLILISRKQGLYERMRFLLVRFVRNLTENGDSVFETGSLS